MSEQEELEALHKLTVAECRVLFWICHNLSCKQIAQELVVTERTVYFHLGNIYQKLGLSERSSAQRRLMLGNLYCPLLDQEVSDPDRDCAKLRQRDSEPVPEPPAETLALVKWDEQRSLIPIQRAIVPVQTKPQGKPPPEIIVVRPPAQALPPQRRSFWPVVISLGVGAVLMFLILRGLGWLPGANQPPAAPTWTPQPTETRAVAQQPVATAAPTKTSVPTATPVPTPTIQKTTGTVNVAIANMRSGPGGEYDLVSQLNKDARLEIIGTNPARDWWEVRLSGGGTGWIHKEYLYITSGCAECVQISRIPEQPTPPRVVLALPFEDRFDPRPRSEWQPQRGTWRVVDGWYTGDVANPWSVSLAGDEGWTDYALDVDVRYLYYHSPARIIVRARGGSYMVLETDCCGTDWILLADGQERKVAHSEAVGLTGGLASGWHQDHLRVEVKNDIYTAYSGGTKLLQVQDPTLRNGRVGLAMEDRGENSLRFDNFIVTALR